MRWALAGILVVLMAGIAVAGFAVARRPASDDTACATRVAPGGDVSKAIFEAPAGGTVCLEAGVFAPFRVARPRAGVTVRGAGTDLTAVDAGSAVGIEVTDAESVTLAGLEIRGGTPAGIYAARTRGLMLADLRLLTPAIGIHLDGAAASLERVRMMRTREFGLLIRRGSSATVQDIDISASAGIGIAAVDDPGPVTLRAVEVAHPPGAGKGEGIVLNGFQRFVLTGVHIRGADPAGIYIARAREASLADVHVDKARFGLHLDENATGTLDGVELTGGTGIALLMQRGASLTANHLTVLDTAGTGISLINGAGMLTLRDSEISRVAAAGLFAGVAGCDDLPPATLDIPDCFNKDPEAQISTIRVAMQGVQMADTQGPCLVFFPGVRASVQSSHFLRCELTGLFAWGATVDVSGSTFEDNAEHAIEYRAYPDPRGRVIAAAGGTIGDTVVVGTRPLQGEVLGARGPAPVLGGGILAQGSRLILRRTEVRANRDIGVSFVNGSSGEVSDSRIVDNGGYGICLLPGVSVVLRDTTVTGNRSDAPTVCGGRPATGG